MKNLVKQIIKESLNSNSKLFQTINTLKKDLVDAAQKVYNQWEQDEEGYDEYYGSGGICDDIAEAMCDVINNKTQYGCFYLYNEYDCHTSIYVYDTQNREIYNVDIPPYVYEQGTAYTWKKIPDVQFFERNVTIENRSYDYDDFIDEDGEVKENLNEEEDYRGSHTAPSKEENASMDNLTNIYPDDIYSDKAVRYYGDGHPFDRLAIYIMQSAKDKPNKLIKIYRAVPDLNFKINKQIKELLKINQYYDKFNFFPINNNIIDNLKYDYPIEKYSYDKQTQLILSDISKQIDNLKNQLKNTKLTINSGDWVTITPQYANLHGQAHLNNKYKVLTKTVPAKTLYTDANSIHEWGYNP